MEDAVGIVLALGIAYIAFRYFFVSDGSPSRRRQIPQATIDNITSMFPDIPLANIRYELERTGNAEGTVERCLRDGRLPDAPAGYFVDDADTSRPSAPARSTTTATATSFPPKSLIARLGLQNRLQEVRSAPAPVVQSKGKGKVRTATWEGTTKEREVALAERKAKRVLEARRVILERESKGGEVDRT